MPCKCGIKGKKNLNFTSDGFVFVCFRVDFFFPSLFQASASVT